MAFSFISNLFFGRPGIWPLPYYCDNCSICQRRGCLCHDPGYPNVPPPKNIELNQQDIQNSQQIISSLFRNLAVIPQLILGFDPTLDLAFLNKTRVHVSTYEKNDIIVMVEAAKIGDWDTVFNILSTKPIIINCIPCERAWGVLHQAAWSEKLIVVSRLLQFESCDPFLKTKQDKDGKYGPGKTADMLTENEKIREAIVEAQEKKRIEREALQDKSFVSVENEKDIKIDSIFLTLASFQHVLYPEAISSNDSFMYSTLLKESFDYINSERGSRWELARREVALQLEMVDIPTANFLATGDENGDIFAPKIETKEDFFSRVILIYTKNNSISKGSAYYTGKPLFSALNKSLRTQGGPVTSVIGEDLALAAYGILLNSILLFWNVLMPTKQMTYRGMDLPLKVIDEYKVGNSFTWLCFTSSTVKKRVTDSFGSQKSNQKCVFHVLNENVGKFSSKGISDFSQYPGESEYLYPSGAKFRVVNLEHGFGIINVTIIREDYSK